MKLSTKTITALLFAAAAYALPAKVTYDGTKVLRIETGDSEKAAAGLKKIITDLGLPLWTQIVAPNTHVDFEVPKEKFAAFKKAVAGEFTYETMHEDLGASIKEESSSDSISAFDVSIQAADLSWFNAYHPYADHLTWLSQLVARFPGNSEIITAGNSYQSRPITGIHIYGTGGKGNRPAIIYHGTVHAREWITTMTTEYIAYNLLNNYANSTEVKGYVDKYDFYIFPVVNPDGFVYTQTTQRLWRKNRQPTSGSTCIGHDINRNWNAFWAVSGGASTNPCDETFKGSTAGDTPEYKGLSAFQNALAASPAGAKSYIDWHSYSQLFMTPYGYSCTAVAADNTELVSLARGAAAAIRAVYGTTFTAGPICTTIYQATGGSVDYAYDVSKIKYSFTTELRDTGRAGFVLPANQIAPSGVEAWAGVKYLLANMR